MKEKFKIERIESLNDNDCWCIAISQALGLKYETVYKYFKHIIYDDKSLESDIVSGYFKRKGYTITKTNRALMDSIRMYNRSGGVVFGMKDSRDEHHVVYIKENTIYEGDGLDDDMLWWYLKEYTVKWVAIKLNGFV